MRSRPTRYREVDKLCASLDPCPTRYRGFVSIRNPTHGSGWIVQIRPTNVGFASLRIPPTEVGGWFRSNLLVYSKANELKSFLNALCHSASEAGSETSTNSRWRDSRSRFVISCRLDLKHPPTSVG